MTAPTEPGMAFSGNFNLMMSSCPLGPNCAEITKRKHEIYYAVLVLIDYLL